MHVVVIGSGIAGLTAALAAAGRHDVTLLTKADLAESNTRYAQGGIAAALDESDSPAAHALDTQVAGAGLCAMDAVRALTGDGPARVRELIERGVAFDRDGDRLARGLEGAHRTARILHAGGDATGRAIETALVEAVRTSGAVVVEHAFVTDLIVRDGAVIGARWLDASHDPTASAAPTPSELRADAVIVAAGGAGQLYAHTTNPTVATGDGVAAALRAGALLADLEFYQFHPTALALAGNFLVSEAVRGEGAVLLNGTGERFMPRYDERAELAARDVVARSIAHEMVATGQSHVLLDATGLGADFLARRFPTIDAACRAQGCDWSREPIPVTPAAHYWMGGIATDRAGRTSLPGLFAVGEAACTGVHGANRLASNSLLEGLVFAHRAVAALDRDDVEARRGAPTIGEPGDAVDVPLGSAVADDGTRPTDGTVTDGRTITDDATTPSRADLQTLMWNAAGLTRDAAGLEAARDVLGRAPASAPPRRAAEYEDENLRQLALALVTAALHRTESRGAHHRRDHPAESADWLRHTVLRAVPESADAHHHETTHREAATAC